MADEIQSAAEGGDALDLVRELATQIEWSRKTFGAGHKTDSVLAHISQEIDEVRRNPEDLTEWIDIALLALDGAWRCGPHTADVVVARMVEKMRINRARQWAPVVDGQPTRHVEEAHPHSPDPEQLASEPAIAALLAEVDRLKSIIVRHNESIRISATAYQTLADAYYARLGERDDARSSLAVAIQALIDQAAAQAKLQRAQQQIEQLTGSAAAKDARLAEAEKLLSETRRIQSHDLECTYRPSPDCFCGARALRSSIDTFLRSVPAVNQTCKQGVDSE